MATKLAWTGPCGFCFMSENGKKRVLNLRSCPADLVWQAKEAAAAERITLTEFVVRALRVAVEKHQKREREVAVGN